MNLQLLALWRSKRPHRLVGLALTAVCLAWPSLWLLKTVPPLWRDSDGHSQTTGRPGAATILLHGPLYSFASRAPLYAGHLFDGISGAPVRPPGDFLVRPSLSDSGVYALLLTQHAALLAAQMFLVTSISAVAWVRCAISVSLAANAVVYTFAHCVTSESLSTIGLIVLATLGLRLVRRTRKISVRDWLLLGIVLTLLMLTRQVNAVFAALLPAAFLLLALQRMIRRFSDKSDRARPQPALRERRALRRGIIAAGIGVACLIASIICIRLLCAAADISYRSKTGFTFTWRLKVLQDLPPDERDRLLGDAGARASTPDAKRLIALLGETLRNASGAPLDNIGFMNAARPVLFPPGTSSAAIKMDRALNEMAKAFLVSNPDVFGRLALNDFAELRRTTLPDLNDFLFRSTAYQFDSRKKMPDPLVLSTYRNSNADTVIALATRYAYLRWWSGLSYNAWLLVWGACLGVVLLLARFRRTDAAAVISYACALLLTGLTLLLLNCFLTEALVRFTLPMFQMLFVSLALLLGHILERIGSSRRRVPSYV